MFVAFPRPPESDTPLHEASTWIDLMDPTEAEVRLVEQTTGLHVPTLAELSEIETSSRLVRRGDTLYLSMPALERGEGLSARSTPVGFVLSRNRLITVRFAAMPAFDQVANDCRARPTGPGSSVEVFLSLIEGTVDRIADLLEHEGDTLDRISRRVFRPEKAGTGREVDRELRGILRRVGALGDLIGKVRDTLLGVGRIVQYVTLNASEWCGHEQRQRFKTLRADILSLNEYDAHLFSKLQFLLDATVGLIGIEQSNKFTLLTIVSIVGIPPTLIASIYGMNFEHIPELHWAWGYWYGLAVIAISGVLPLLWFRRKGWL
jgi:magnesium transporter